MTTVLITFAATWITDLATSTSVQVYKTERTEQDSLDVQVRNYAGGRRRIISTPARVRLSALTFRRVSVADVETLRTWRGRILLLRDAQGWRRWGTYADIVPATVSPAPSVPTYEVSLTWQDVDYDESV